MFYYITSLFHNEYPESMFLANQREKNDFVLFFSFKNCSILQRCVNAKLPAIVAMVKTCSTFNTSSSITVNTTNTARIEPAKKATFLKKKRRV